MAAPPHDVFLSHSSKDKDFVKELYRRLTRDGVRCFFDIESIGWGDNWVRALERAIDECSYIVFVLSPDFCNSEWVEVERTSSIAGDPSGLKRKVRPLMLHQCRDLPTFPRFLRQVQAIDVSTSSLFEQNYPRICRELGGEPQPDLRADLVAADRSKLPPVHPLPERHRMPYHSLGDKFIGRVGAIWDLYDSLFHDGTTVLQGTGVVAGTGGLGKTQIAIEYAHRFGPVYTGGVYWVNADRGLTEMISRISAACGHRHRHQSGGDRPGRATLARLERPQSPMSGDPRQSPRRRGPSSPTCQRQDECTPSSPPGGRTCSRPRFVCLFYPFSESVSIAELRSKGGRTVRGSTGGAARRDCHLPLSFEELSELPQGSQRRRH